MKKTFRLGTRRSLLAMAQSRWVASELHKLNPELTIELVGIETKGDQIVDIPLRQAQGQNFFVTELDNALAAKEIDLCVHSMKDLGLDRPAGVQLAAVPERELPHDVILFQPKILQVLEFEKRPLRIGTSSPRRLANIPAFLKKALPRIQSHPTEIEWVEIRGNVNTRLSRLHLPIGDAKFLDGVVLASAGITRLQRDDEGSRELSKLLLGVRTMMLPIRECPTAPAQGALAIECRTDDADLFSCIQKMNHTPTADAVREERAILAEWGGGCHQKLGATAIQQDRLGRLLYINGVKPKGQRVFQMRWSKPARPAGGSLWDGSLARRSLSENQISAARLKWTRGRPAAVFVAHSRAVTDQILKAKTLFRSDRVWTSGTASWFRLAEKGIWVEGCAEEMGWETFMSNQQKVPWLLLNQSYSWAVLTHANTGDSWTRAGVREVMVTYEVAAPVEERTDFLAGLSEAQFIYWSSASQFETHHALAKADAVHACGAGRTADVLEKKWGKAGERWQVFPSVTEWRTWAVLNSGASNE